MNYAQKSAAVRLVAAALRDDLCRHQSEVRRPSFSLGVEASPSTETSASAPKGDNERAIEFLRWMQPEGPWALSAINPAKVGSETATFYPGDVEKLTNWLSSRNGKRNLYFHVNEVDGPLQSKASKERMRAAHWLHVDVDPRKDHDIVAEQGRILASLQQPPDGIEKPTLITFSGGGYQAFWKLENPVLLQSSEDAAAEFERFNRHLEAAFDGDNCHNVDRIMRLPFTVNLPDAKKRAKGRVAALAVEIERHDDRVYPLGAFQQAPPLGQVKDADARSVLTDAPQKLASLDQLAEWSVPDRVLALISAGDLRRTEGPKPKDDSRSAWLFDCICGLVRCGVPLPLVHGIITDPQWTISESVLDKGRGADRYARRQIERARDANGGFAMHAGKPVASARNIRIAIAKLGVVVEHDTFADRALIHGLDGFGPRLNDAALRRLWLTVDEMFDLKTKKELFWDVVLDHAHQNERHPVRNYLDALVWDGQARLDTWLSVYGGAADTAYVRAVGALTLIAAVRRVRQPGCKFDEMLVLESAQGMNKSTALRTLARNDDWFSDDLPLNVGSQVVIERTAGKWIVEAGELKGMKRGDVEHLKTLLSRGTEEARMAYGRMSQSVPRQFVIVGTTNASRYLQDTTGNRRFWPVTVGGFDIAALTSDRDQLWAEAAAREAQGASIRLDPALYAEAAGEQKERQSEDPWFAILDDVLGDLTGKLLAEDAWMIIDRPKGQRTQPDNERFGAVMKELGFTHVKRRFGGEPKNAYVRGSANERCARILIDRTGDRTTARSENAPAPIDDEIPF